MYSKHEASALKCEFWTVFGQYMRPVVSADGETVNWINYKTGEKQVFFKADANNNTATVAIELHHTDKAIRDLYFDQFVQLRKQFEIAAGKAWHWEANSTDEFGKNAGRIFVQKDAVSIFRREDWPVLISFFKQHLMALDKFWSEVKYAFETLR